MARPHKSRRVCGMPCCLDFFTEATAENAENRIILNVDEYETVRVIDYVGLTQEQSAAQMEVGRATVQALYAAARKKLARFLIEGSRLQIAGGNYRVNRAGGEGRGRKERNAMKIAVTYENGMIFQHFGHTQQFKLYQVEDGKVASSEIVDAGGSGHGALAGFLKEKGAEVLICGGIGGGARNALAEAGIKLYPGAAGDADAQVESLLAGSLSYDPDTVCNHHGHGHEDGHDCGHSHGDGHSCGHGHCGGR